MTQPIPQGYATVTAVISVDNCAELIETCKKAFEAKENPEDRTQCPETGKIMHTVIEIGNSKIMMSDMFWGDRLGAVRDRCGIQWSIATHVRDVSREDLEKGAKEMAKQMKAQAGQKAA